MERFNNISPLCVLKFSANVRIKGKRNYLKLDFVACWLSLNRSLNNEYKMDVSDVALEGLIRLSLMMAEMSFMGTLSLAA